jgi:hypothetical protein
MPVRPPIRLLCPAACSRPSLHTDAMLRPPPADHAPEALGALDTGRILQTMII